MNGSLMSLLLLLLGLFVDECVFIDCHLWLLLGYCILDDDLLRRGSLRMNPLDGLRSQLDVSTWMNLLASGSMNGTWLLWNYRFIHNLWLLGGCLLIRFARLWMLLLLHHLLLRVQHMCL